MLGNQLLNFISEIEKISTDLDPVYTTCEAGKRRSVNHTRAHARSPRRAGPRARAWAWAWRGEARRDAAGRAVRVRVRDVT